MSACGFDNLLGPYHDGELDPLRRDRIEQHLPGCADCSRHLAELRALTDRLSAVTLGQITPMEKAIIQQAVHKGTMDWADRAVLRMAIPLASLAASLLIVTSIGLADNMLGGRNTADQNVASSGDWQQVAVASHTDSRLPDWMVRGLGGQTP
jgi:anti-sigma factor RsiW